MLDNISLIPPIPTKWAEKALVDLGRYEEYYFPRVSKEQEDEQAQENEQKQEDEQAQEQEVE